MRKMLMIVVLGLNLLGCMPGYSEGSRTGNIIKFSRKGFLCKSWEGTMVLGGLAKSSDGTVAANTWDFTVRDEGLLEKLNAAQETGKPVTLTYDQWYFSTPCMESDYVVTGIK